jgi:hypothetical protein
MSAKRVEYHQGAIADIKSAVFWYEKHSRKAALDFIEELNIARPKQSVKPQIAGPAERIIQNDSCFGGSHSLLSIRKKNPKS